jgi:hypothetical protein
MCCMLCCSVLQPAIVLLQFACSLRAELGWWCWDKDGAA